jgi:ribosomal protein S18 acetylase RimI-like enzyme
VAEDLDRAARLGRWLQDRTSTRFEPFRWGTAVFNDEIPERFFSNFVRVEKTLAGIAVVDLVRETDHAMSGLGHRQIQILDETDGARVAADLAAAGYAAEHSATLAHRSQPDRTYDVGLVEELPFAAVRSFLAEVYRRALPDAEPRVVDRFAEFRHVVQHLVGTRFFARRIDAAVAGLCELYLHDKVAQVEHVDTLEEFRGRGIASSLVLCAVSQARAAGADLVCIGADLEDWPITVYRGLGFADIGRSWAFTKPPAAAAVPRPNTLR